MAAAVSTTSTLRLVSDGGGGLSGRLVREAGGAALVLVGAGGLGGGLGGAATTAASANARGFAGAGGAETNADGALVVRAS